MANNTLGIITGSGPEAGIDLWRNVLIENKFYLKEKYRGDIDSPEVIIHSNPQIGYELQNDNNSNYVWDNLRKSILLMDDNDVDYYCIACNLLHKYTDQILSLGTQAKLVSIVDVAHNYIVHNNITDFALLSIPSIMQLREESPYTLLLETTNIETSFDFSLLNRIIGSIKTHGVSERLIDDLYYFLEGVESEHLMLACTELPLIFNEINTNKNVIDLNKLLAQEMVANYYT